MDHAVGIDIIEIERIERALAHFKDRFLRRVFTPMEVALFGERPHELAARFAAKEAVMKALGTGARGVGWREIEVLPNRRGKPVVYLHGRAKERAALLGLSGLDVSMSHSRRYAVALAVGHCRPDDGEKERWRLHLGALLRERGLLS